MCVCVCVDTYVGPCRRALMPHQSIVVWIEDEPITWLAYGRQATKPLLHHTDRQDFELCTHVPVHSIATVKLKKAPLAAAAGPAPSSSLSSAAPLRPPSLADRTATSYLSGSYAQHHAPQLPPLAPRWGNGAAAGAGGCLRVRCRGEAGT